MQRGNMNEEKEISESETNEMFLNLKTTEENEREKGNMNEEKEMSDSETSDSEMLLNLKTVEERVAFRRKRDQRFLEGCAKIALAEYNSQNGTNFELDAISCENRCSLLRIIIHINFIAESSNGSNDERKRMFFAEVVGFDERFVSACCILDPVAGMYSGCRFCDHTVYHPRGLCLDPPDLEKRTKKRKQRNG